MKFPQTSGAATIGSAPPPAHDLFAAVLARRVTHAITHATAPSGGIPSKEAHFQPRRVLLSHAFHPRWITLKQRGNDCVELDSGQETGLEFRPPQNRLTFVLNSAEIFFTPLPAGSMALGTRRCQSTGTIRWAAECTLLSIGNRCAMFGNGVCATGGEAVLATHRLARAVRDFEYSVLSKDDLICQEKMREQRRAHGILGK